MAKKKDKLKRKKERKTKLQMKMERKKRQRSFLYRKRKIIYSSLIVCIIVLCCFLFYNYYGVKKEWENTVGLGDTITINFICVYENGDMFLSTILDENATWETKLDDSHRYRPFTYEVGYVHGRGLGRGLEKIDTKFLGKKIGDIVESNIRSEDAFVSGDPAPYYDLPEIMEVERIESMDLNASIPISQFTQSFKTPKEGEIIDTIFGKMVVAKIDEENVYIEFVSNVGEEFYSKYGKAVVEEINKEENKIYIKHNPEIGTIVLSSINTQYLPVEIVDLMEDKIKIKILKYIKIKAKIEEVVKSDKEWIIEEGDQVLIDYVGKLENGDVFDTTYREIADDNSTKKAEIFQKRDEYTPLKIAYVNAGELLSVFEEQLIGMKTGEEKTIKLSPEEAYGEYDEERIIHIKIVDEVPIEETIIKERVIPQKEFIERYGQPVTGMEINTKYGKADILEITPEGDVKIKQKTVNEEISLKYFEAKLVNETEESFTYERIFGSKVNTSYGTATAREEDGKFIVTLDKKDFNVGDTMYTEKGIGTIIEISEREVIVDANHSLAGEILIFEVKIVEIRKHMT
ncbi:MAG: FKBP-type peptidyl-prolyl cis-trans isomerase [Methanomicrobia archaeon]|nr:FKBP-type peptidyl-prolyl cis-trans isomerase [Methanomicrobia archaeon]